MKEKMRTEKDSLGELSVPLQALYGIETMRAFHNFPISGVRHSPALVDAVMLIKKAAAITHSQLNMLEKPKADAVVQACEEALAGQFRDQFIVDVFQMGAGTSFHMNCNEVIANRASEILGGKKGEYLLIHPHDHVNMGQSTNDVFPTAMRISTLQLLQTKLEVPLEKMAAALEKKAVEFDRIIKSGRTHLQDAAPIRLGQEFKAYGLALKKAKIFLDTAAKSLLEIGMGGSAVGTGLNTAPEYAQMIVAKLAEATSFPLQGAENMREATQSQRPLAEVSGALRNIALELNRIANDLRLLSSGPRTGLAEITLPQVAPGSSIMPGKVNPSMLEMLNMVCYQVMGCDLAVSTAVQAGQLELNVMMPVIAFNLHFMIEILGNALREVRIRCIEGITANTEQCRRYAHESLGQAAALSPSLGYSLAAEVAQQALAENKSLTDVTLERGLMTSKQLQKILDPQKMTEPGIPGKRS